jgi:hypothetical protein
MVTLICSSTGWRPLFLYLYPSLALIELSDSASISISPSRGVLPKIVRSPRNTLLLTNSACLLRVVDIICTLLAAGDVLERMIIAQPRQPPIFSDLSLGLPAPAAAAR